MVNMEAEINEVQPLRLSVYYLEVIQGPGEIPGCHNAMLFRVLRAF